MAKPRVFVSSTYYDLKYLRSSLEGFIESLGYDAVLSEKGQIAFTHDVPLDESCYREVRNCDIYVLIIGGRYGSRTSEETSRLKESRDQSAFFERYESITKQEYKAAIEADIRTYVLIERPVYTEFCTFLRNRENKGIKYAYVDSVNIFHLIEEILNRGRNNPVAQFDRSSEMENWLREQWAGLFRELLDREPGQRRIASLAGHIEALAEVNMTLRRYLEELVTKVAPDTGPKLVGTEKARLDEALHVARLQQRPVVDYLTKAEYVIVQFPERREVFMGGVSQGENLTVDGADRILRVSAGMHTFALGGRNDYAPDSQLVDVKGTMPLQPLRIIFTKMT